MNKQQRMIETTYYRFNNLNPKGKFIGDCVIRAIANATNQKWEQTLRELTECAIKIGDVASDRKTFNKYLEQKGFTKMPMPKKLDGTKYEIWEWMNKNPSKIKEYEIVISIANHLTCIKNGKSEDIWNCSRGKKMGNYWLKRK